MELLLFAYNIYTCIGKSVVFKGSPSLLLFETLDASFTPGVQIPGLSMDDMKKYDNFRAYKRDLYGGSDGSGSDDGELGWTDEWYETNGLVCLVRFPVEYLDLVKSRRGSSSSSSEREEEGLPTDQPEKNNSDYITVTFELEEEEEVVEGWKEKKTVKEKLTLEELNVIQKAYLRKEQLDEEEYGWQNILEEKLYLDEFNTTDRVYAMKEQEGEEEEVEEGSKKTVEKKLSLEEFNAIDSANAMEGKPIMIPQKRKRDKPEVLQGLEVEELHPEQVSDAEKEKQKSKRAFLEEDSGAAGCGGRTLQEVLCLLGAFSVFFFIFYPLFLC